MIQLVAFRRSLVALALCSAAIAATSTPVSARSHHSAGRSVHTARAGHHPDRHHTGRHHAYHQNRHVVRVSRWERGLAVMHARGFADSNARVPSGDMGAGAFGSSNVVAEARRYLGGNPTGRGSLWCARFMNMVLQRSGYRGTGSDMAASFASYGRRVSGPQIGAIAVMGRRGGGHVGVVSGLDAAGNPIVVSGNNGHRVREAPVSRARIYAYVMPTA